MNEIEKMYRNSGIKKIELDYPDNFEPFYPEFIAEKQIELYCFISSQDKYIMTFEATLPLTPDVFAEGIAEAVNRIWQDLTDAERKQIKEILE